jgi:aminoglycoside/choline kinase family phosphotransferase
MDPTPEPRSPTHASLDALPDRLAIEQVYTLLQRCFAPKPPPDCQVIPLLGDASDRRYYRLRFASPVDGIASLVLMRLTQPHPERELPFVNVQRYLAMKGIPVPQIFCDDAAHGFVLLEDLGDITLEAALQDATREQLSVWYREALDILLALQHPEAPAPRHSCVAFQLAFDVEKFMSELDFFITYMLKGLCGQRLTSTDEAVLRGQFWKISARLAREPRVLTHRDYHCRNLMLQAGRLRLIDFQDARLGPCHYDLASLLNDSYVVLDSEVREQLLAYYLDWKARAEGHAVDRVAFLQVFDYMCLQRNLKALGTFAYQAVVKRNSRYGTAMPRTLKYIERNLAQHPELQRLRDLLEAHLFAAPPAVLPDAGRHTPDTSPAH